MVDERLEPVIQSLFKKPHIASGIKRLRGEVEERSQGQTQRGPFTLPRYEEDNLFAVDQFLKDTGIDGTGSLLMDIKTLPARVEDGVKLFKSGEHHKALKKYMSALELDPKCVEAYVARGCVFAGDKNYDAAVDDFKKALEINPKHENAHNFLGRVQEKVAEIEREKQSALDGEFLLPADYDPNPSAKKRLPVEPSLPIPSKTSRATSSAIYIDDARPSLQANDQPRKEKKSKDKKRKKTKKKRRKRSTSSSSSRSSSGSSYRSDDRRRKRGRYRSDEEESRERGGSLERGRKGQSTRRRSRGRSREGVWKSPDGGREWREKGGGGKEELGEWGDWKSRGVDVEQEGEEVEWSNWRSKGFDVKASAVVVPRREDCVEKEPVVKKEEEKKWGGGRRDGGSRYGGWNGQEGRY
ncbi:hypothetical protein HDV00_004953 [Rhizophlyctis rosea]|nr:hypothetical protein HDV00_004953 [Rhizophlyctis rosea]